MRTAAFALVTTAVLLLGSSSRAATTVELQLTGEQSPEAGKEYTYTLHYTVSGGDAADATLTLALPDDVAVKKVVTPPTFIGDCTVDSAGSGQPAYAHWRFSCAYDAGTLAGSVESLTGNIEITVLYRAFEFPKGTVVTLGAELDFDDPGPRSETASLPVTMRSAAHLVISDFNIDSYWTHTGGTYDPDGAAGPAVPMTGMYYRIPISWRNDGGNATLTSGQRVTVPFGPNTWFVAVSSDNPSGIDTQGRWSFIYPDSSATVGQPGNTLVLSYDERVGSWGTYDANGNRNRVDSSVNLWVTVFIPCDHLGDNLAMGPTGDAPFRFSVTGIEQQVGATVSISDSETVPRGAFTAADLPYFFAGCASPGGAGKVSAPMVDVPVGTNVTWYLSFDAPTGDVPWTEALVVDPVPYVALGGNPPPTPATAKLGFVDAKVATGRDVYSKSFTAYFCNLGAVHPNERFTLAEFHTYLAAGTCRPRMDFYGAFSQSPPPWPISETTHAVAWAPSPGGWNDALSATDTTTRVMQRVVLQLDETMPLEAKDDELVVNVAGLQGKIGEAPRPAAPETFYLVEDPIKAKGEADPIVNILTLRGSLVADGIAQQSVFSRGEPIWFAVSFERGSGMALKDPTLVVTFPPGVDIDTFEYLKPGNCAMAAPGITLSRNSAGTADPSDDYYVANVTMLPAPISRAEDHYTNGCGNPLIASGTWRAFQVKGSVRESYPHHDGAPLTARALLSYGNATAIDLTTDNADEVYGYVDAYHRVAKTTFSVTVPAEARVTLAPECSPDLGPAFVTYRVDIANSAGADLSGVTTVIAVPKEGVPADNTIDATLYALTGLAAGDVLEYSTDGAATWLTAAPPDLATITHLRVTIPGLPAYTTRTVELIAAIPVTTALGTPVLTAATLEASGLLRVDNATYTPWSAGSCPTRLTVFKYRDEEPHGPYDSGAGDVPLADWRFDTAGPTVTGGSTNGAGEVTFDVLPGDYTVTETLPVSGATWTPTYPGDPAGLSQVAKVGLEPFYRLEFGNACGCGDDLCKVCDATGACVPKALECGDAATCQLPGACDPATGQCAYEPKPCTPLPIYVVVNDAQGQPYGRVTCHRMGDGTVDCDMDGPYVAVDRNHLVCE